MNHCIHSILVSCLLGLSGVTSMTVSAQEAPPGSGPSKEAVTPRSQTAPFRGKIAAVDKEARTIKLEGRQSQRIIKLSPDVKILKNGKPASLKDATVGEEIAGQLRRVEGGEYYATSIRLGPKPEGEAPEPGAGTP